MYALVGRVDFVLEKLPCRYVCEYVYVYVYMGRVDILKHCSCMNASLRMYVCMYVCMQICTCINTYVYINVPAELVMYVSRACVCLYMCVCVCAFV